MFDAAAAATAAEVNQEQVAQEQAESAVSAEGSGEPTAAENESQDLLQAISSYNPGESTTEVVFVDPTVPDYQSLIAGMGPNVQIVMLDGGQDGMEQIAASLTGRTGIDAIHIISHGAEGQLSLGTGTLTTDSMTGEYADELAAIQQALSAQADILVYGCDFANGLAGQDAVTLLSQLTGADVAASTDDTGYAGLGGDWEFEIQTGTIETQVVIDYDTQADWVGLLAGETPPTISNLSGDSLAYSEGSGAVVIEQGGNVTVSDVDSTNFNTGTLTVSIPSGGDSAEDVLSIRNQGTGAGQIGVSGSNVTYGGVIIGTFTGGSSGSNLVITLNSSATPTAVTALVKNITYQNTDTNSPTTGARTVRFVLTDGDGGTSANYNTTVTVSGVNDAPADLSAGIELNTDGGNDAYLISDTGLSQSLTATTVEIRFAANDLPLETVLMSFNNPSGDELSIQLDEPANDLELDFGAGNVALASAIDYRAALVDGAVHTLSVTWDNAAGNWSVYIDGVHIESGTGLNVGTALDTTNGRFVFGQEQDGQNSGYDSTQYFSGTFYDVRIWNDVRTAGEIAQYYEQQLDVTPAEAAAAGLVANWQMDGLDGSNQVVELVSGNNLSIAHASGTGFTTGAVNSQLSIDENSANGSHVGFVVAGDPDASETFSYSLTDSAGGRFAVDSITGEVTVANGTLLNYESATSHSVSVRVTDSGGLTYDETLTINLTNVAESPIANDDTAITMVNAPVTIDVIANDMDPEGDVITVLDYTVPANGTVTDNLDGTVTYTPDTNYQGADSFDYLIADASEAPAHYWRLDGDATDLIGGSNGVVNGATTVEGRYGSALSFDEVNDYVRLPDVTYTSDFSISFMLKVDDLSGTSYQYLYSHGVFNTQNSINVFLGETGGVGPLLYTRVLDANDSAPGTTSFDVSSIVGDGQWHTYTLTISASAGMNVYLDGDLKLSDSARGKDGINPSGDAYLGARKDLDSARFFGGSLDSVAIYDHALSASQVTNLHSPGDALATVTVTVEPNSAPTDLTLSANTVAENVANGTIVGTVTGTDPNVSDTKSYSFTDSAGGRFAINSSTGQITVADGSLLNYEAATSHSVTVRVTDAGGLTYDETFTINLTNVNEAPTGADATVTINEDSSHILATANFGLSDVDAGDSLSAVRIDTVPGAGSLTLSGVAVTAGQVITAADITAGNLVFTPVADANGTGYTSFTFSVRDSNNAYDAAPNTLTIDVTAVNDASTITSLSGDSLAYSEGDGAVVIEQGSNALVADVDSSNLDTGTLTVSIPSGGDSTEDVLSIRNQGTSAGQIGVSGSNITYGGTIIGTFTGGSGGSNLVITLNSSVTPTAVTALIKNITYENTDTNAPTTGVRTVRYVLTDGDGGTSANYDTTVTVGAVNDAPVVTPVAPDVTFVEGGLAQVIDATGTITDVDSANFDGGVLTVSISANGTVDDRLMVGNFGTGPGQVGVSGSDVTYGGTVIGTVSGGGNGSDPFVITFNTSATPSAVQEVYRSIQFSNVSDDPSTATRTLTIELTDGDGGTATPQTKLVYVQGANDAPVLTFGEGDKNFTEGALAVMIDTLPTISDLDSTNFDTGTLTITISANPRVDDRVELLNTGMGAGQIGVSGTNVYYGGTLIGTQAGGIGAAPFVVTFNTNADADVVGEVMANIRFWVAGDSPSTATRTVEAVLTDGDGGTSLTASKQITVTAVNDPTVVTGGTSGSGTEDSTVTGTLTATDSDGLSDGSVFSVSTNATNGTASIDPATGLWSYSPNADYNGSDSFTVTITDDAGNSSTQVISVTVTPVVDLTNDSLTTAEDTAISANVLTGTNGATADSFEGTPVLTSVTQGANGSVTFLADGTVTYTPNANYTGPDSFTYTITSGGVTETATVTVTVTAVNDPTVVTGGTSGTGNEDTTVTGTLTATDSDGLSDGTVFSVSATATNGTASIDPATGLWSYTPTADWNGTDSFTVTITDDAGNSSTQVISVTVTPVVDLTNDSLTTNEDSAISANVLTGTNGATADNFEGTPVLTSVTQGANGSVTFLADGTVTYTPNANYTGPDSFTYTITSGGVTETATVTVTVSAVNDPTVNTMPGAQTTAEDTSLVFSSSNGNQISLTDVDAGGNPVEVTVSVTNGTVTLSGTTGLTFISGDGITDTTMTFRGTVTDINTALNGLSYNPTADYNGGATLTLRTVDSMLVSLSVDASLKGSYTFESIGALGTDTSPAAGFTGTVSGATSVNDATRGNVLSLDGDDNVQITGNFGNPANATLAAWVNLTSVNPNGGGSEVISLGDNLLLRLEHPTAGMQASYYDGTTWKNITFPAFLAGTGWHHVAFSFNDAGNTATLYLDGAAVASTSTTDSISYTRGTDSFIGQHGAGNSAFNFTGMIDDARVYDRALSAAEIQALASDLNQIDTDSVAITVNAVDDATVVTGGTSGSGTEDTTITGTLTATDSDGLSDGTVFTVSATATNGTASIDPATGLWSYTPNADWNGSDSFTVTITDDAGNSSTQVISVTVTPVVDLTNDSLTTNEDTAISANVLTGTNGATADSFEGTPVLTSVTQGANGSVTFLANGTVTYTPTANFTGPDSFTYSITSGGVTETATVTVTVTAVNDPTVVTGGTSGTGTEDSTLTGTLTATDVEGLSDGSVFTVSANATNGTASIDPVTGLWSYTPNADWNGSDSFTVTITDDAGNSSTQVISVTVTPVNDAPTLTVNTGSTVAEGGTDTIGSSELAVTDIEQTAAQLVYSIGAGPAYGRLELTTAPGVSTTTFTQADIAANRLIYIHNGSETTSDSFTFTVGDGAGGTLGTTTMTLTITPVNDTPTITSAGGASTAAINVAENVSAVTIVTGADVDLPAQAITYSLSGGADQARFTINTATGALNFAAPPDFEAATDANGDNVYVVQVQVTDSQGASTTQTIQVTVADVVEGVLPIPTPPPVLLPTTPPSPTGPEPVPSRPLGPAEPPTDALPQAPVLPDSRSAPAESHPATVLPSPTERLVVIRPEEPRATIDEAKDSVLFPWIEEARRLLVTGLLGEPTSTPESELAEKSQSVSDLLFSKLDEMTASLEQAMGVSQEQQAVTVRITALTGTVLSAGFIVWVLRSGTLLASLMVTMPAWRHFDPLPVLGGSRSEWARRRKEAEEDQQAENTQFKGLKHLLDLGLPPDPKP
jgi:VCBS repeat-containing protein